MLRIPMMILSLIFAITYQKVKDSNMDLDDLLLCICLFSLYILFSQNLLKIILNSINPSLQLSFYNPPHTKKHKFFLFLIFCLQLLPILYLTSFIITGLTRYPDTLNSFIAGGPDEEFRYFIHYGFNLNLNYSSLLLIACILSISAIFIQSSVNIMLLLSRNQSSPLIAAFSGRKLSYPETALVLLSGVFLVQVIWFIYRIFKTYRDKCGYYSQDR
ncbi:MAG: hypothetical protein ACTSYD_05810 [Candidatus Heimdallarchaeaceae archaeon]